MIAIKQYILSIIVSSVLISILDRLTNKNIQLNKQIKLVSSIFMTVVIILPVSSVDISDCLNYMESIRFDASEVTAEGDIIYKEHISKIIKEECESYILEKARQLGVSINVEIYCTDSDIPSPLSAYISGTVSPHAKECIQRLISEDLGIPKEEQIWT